MAKDFGGGRGGPANRRFPDVTGTKQVDPRQGPSGKQTPVKGAGKPRPDRPSGGKKD